MQHPEYDKKHGFVSRSFDVGAVRPAIDLHAQGASRTSKSISLKGSLSGIGDTTQLDVNAWLPAASEHYNISKDLRDYVLHPTVVTLTGIPNTNGDGFELRDWLTFRPELGQLAFKTFKGKPTFVEHANSDYRVARGVILDSRLSQLKGYDQSHARLHLLLAFDRSLEPELCGDILSGEHNTYSKGTWYKAYTCSVCGETFTGRSRQLCGHVGNRVRRLPDGRLAYRQCHILEGFECSAVRNPAFVCAAPPPESVMDPQNRGRW